MSDNREALARVIDPEEWELYDIAGKHNRPDVQEDIVKKSLKTADRVIASGLMTNLQWERREYINAKRDVIVKTSRQGYCYSVEDGLDGYVLHDVRCAHWPDSAISGSECISSTRR